MTDVNQHASAAANDAASYRRIFSSTSLIGGASVINILIGLVRMKVVAVLLGPVGVGLIGLYSSLMSTAATVTQLGVGTVGTRQIAEAHAKSDTKSLALARRALLLTALVLSVAGGLGVWLARDLLARRVLSDAEASGAMAWLALGVALSVAGASQSALIQGMRRMRELALISVLGALLGTVIGVPLLWWLGPGGTAAYVALAPALSFVLGHVFVARLPKGTHISIGLADMAPQWIMFFRLALPFWVSSLAAIVIELWIRADIQRQLGPESLGHFQASWTIAMQYVGFVLGAMGADYYPRLTAVIDKPAEACRLVNQQTEVALLLSGCAILALVAVAPWVIALLYTADFAEAAPMLRWQALGTALKVASWPLGFVMLAAGAGRTFFISECLTFGLMAGLLHVLIARIGLQGAGIAYFTAYAFYLPLAYWLAVRSISFRWSADVKRTFFALAALMSILSVIISTAPAWGPAASLACVSVFFAYALKRLIRLGLGGAIVALTDGSL